MDGKLMVFAISTTLVLVACLTRPEERMNEATNQLFHLAPPDVYSGQELASILRETVIEADPFFLWTETEGTFAAVWSDEDGEIMVAVTEPSGEGMDSWIIDPSESRNEAWAARLPAFRDTKSYLSQFKTIYHVHENDLERFVHILIASRYRVEPSRFQFQTRHS